MSAGRYTCKCTGLTEQAKTVEENGQVREKQKIINMHWWLAYRCTKQTELAMGSREWIRS